MAVVRKHRKSARTKKPQPLRTTRRTRTLAASPAIVAELKPEPLLDLEPAAAAVGEAVIKTAEPEDLALPRGRERGSYDGDTAIKLYLREIGQVKLLTPQEEIELAARIKKGDKKAREQMIKANLRLVVKIAH